MLGVAPSRTGRRRRVTKYVASGRVVASVQRPGADLVGGAVAEHHPVRRGAVTRHVVRRLEVGLVEAGEDPRRGVEEQVARRRSPGRPRGRRCGAGPRRRCEYAIVALDDELVVAPQAGAAAAARRRARPGRAPCRSASTACSSPAGRPGTSCAPGSTAGEPDRGRRSRTSGRRWSRSRSTSYDVTSISAARAAASTRVRLAMATPLQTGPGVSSRGSRRHRLEAGDPLGHRRVGRHQPRDVLRPERVGDHHVAGVDDSRCGASGARATPVSSLRSAEARASGSPVSVGAVLVGVVLAGAADGHLDDHRGERRQQGQARQAIGLGGPRRCRHRRTCWRTSASAPIAGMTPATAAATDAVRMSRL